MDIGRNIVIIPDQDVINEAVRRSRKAGHRSIVLSQQNNITLATEKGYWPHITLYQCGIPERNKVALEYAVWQVAAETKPFSITLKGYELYRQTGIFWLVQRPCSELQRLHEELVSKVNEIREGVVPPQHRELFDSDSGISIGQRAMLGQWGYPNALKQYQPHVTLADTKAAPEIIDELPSTPVDFEVNQVHISDLGPYGTCPGSLRALELGGK